jgi:translation initiation factor IF-2
MTRYRYGTILEVQNDDSRNGIDEGDILIEAGKLDDGDSYTVLTDDGPVTVEMETVAVYQSDTVMGEREAKEFARDQYVAEQEADA